MNIIAVNIMLPIILFFKFVFLKNRIFTVLTALKLPIKFSKLYIFPDNRCYLIMNDYLSVLQISSDNQNQFINIIVEVEMIFTVNKAITH